MRRFGCWAATAALVTGTLVGCAGTPFGRGQRCLPAQPTATPATVPAGGEVTLASRGFGGCDTYAEPIDQLVILGTAGRMPPTPLATITAATDGSFSTTVTIPPDAPPGEGYLDVMGSRWDECDDSGSCVGYGTTILITSPVSPTQP